MKESSPSPWFATRILHAGTPTSRSHSEKPKTPFRVGSSCSPSSLNSSSSSSSSFSSPFSCHHGSPVTSPSPFRSSLVIPFSWEKQPGVPKHSYHLHHPKEHHRFSSCPKLPLPPPFWSHSEPYSSAPRRKKRADQGPAADPFALALAECSREDRPDPAEDEGPTGGLYWKRSPVRATKAPEGRRRAAGEWFGFVGLYGSCKTTCSVADSTVCISRSGRGPAGYGLLARRAGEGGRAGRVTGI